MWIHIACQYWSKWDRQLALYNIDLARAKSEAPINKFTI